MIVVQDTTDYPLLFHRTLDPDYDLTYRFYEFALFDKALTKEQASEILDLMQQDKRVSARARLRHCIHVDDPICTHAGEVMLDDMLPDDWYGSWKEMEACITTRWNQEYREADVLVNDGGLF